MIGDVLLVALGFCAATLLALAFLPAVWNRALRLTRRRLEMLVPLSEAEVAGRIDGVRAEAAVAQRRLEQRIEDVTGQAAAVTIELGRRTAALVNMELAKTAAVNRNEELAGELARTTSNLVTSEAEVGALQIALWDVEGRLTRAEDRASSLGEVRARLELSLEEDRAAVASLETKASGLAAHIEDLDGELLKLKAEREELLRRQDNLRRERDAARADALMSGEQRANLQQQLKDEANRTADRSVRMQAKSEALARAERRIMEQAAEIKASVGALADLKQRFEALQHQLLTRVVASAGDKPLSHDDLLALRKEIITAADDALLLLHNPVQTDMSVPDGVVDSLTSMPKDSRPARGAEALL
jgi:chromosome segregation ATPase